MTGEEGFASRRVVSGSAEPAKAVRARAAAPKTTTADAAISTGRMRRRGGAPYGGTGGTGRSCIVSSGQEPAGAIGDAEATGVPYAGVCASGIGGGAAARAGWGCRVAPGPPRGGRASA
ncbi:hypothetical protein [Streptomyces sp. ICC1]|uniref:hypothetical protein n=1 Tax=Streptomyces sp. ICC1 TaxID=2099583 RepID=UPI0013A69F64|nr:hypothetical protein [Streptomyces sp. ICC1]